MKYITIATLTVLILLPKAARAEKVMEYCATSCEGLTFECASCIGSMTGGGDISNQAAVDAAKAKFERAATKATAHAAKLQDENNTRPRDPFEDALIEQEVTKARADYERLSVDSQNNILAYIQQLKQAEVDEKKKKEEEQMNMVMSLLMKD